MSEGVPATRPVSDFSRTPALPARLRSTLETSPFPVFLVSLEMEEIRSLSDRVLVIYEGQIVAEMSPEASEEDFGVMMTGGGRGEAS